MREQTMHPHRFIHIVLSLCGLTLVATVNPGNIATSQELQMRLWPGSTGRIDTAGEVTESTDIVRIKGVRVPDILVYLPARTSATGQGVVVCPGGAYRGLAYDWEGKDIAKWLNANGIAAFVLKYRLPDAFTDSQKHVYALEDAQRAIRIARQHAHEWGILPDRIGVMGFSAGGHLAASLGTCYTVRGPHRAEAIDTISARPDFMILMYPVISMTEPYTHMGSRHSLLGDHPDSALIRQYSPQLQVTDNTPPAFIVHAFDDKAVPVENSIIMFDALRAHNIPVEMHIFPMGGHGFGLGLKPGMPHAWTTLCIDWLRRLSTASTRH
jgi:acetyl esterase/lipase